jgi:hypothetical protein
MDERFQRAIALIDEENSRDPNQDLVDGRTFPRELVYSQRLTDWVLKLEPGASDALRLAARSQHIGRWKIPRSSYPEGRAGYLRWRTELKRFHAEVTTDILRKVNYDETTISRVRELNLKEAFPSDPEARVLEDALCLVFLEFQFSELAARLGEEKLVNALRKSWEKMSERGRKAALTLPFTARGKTLLHAALETPKGIA